MQPGGYSAGLAFCTFLLRESTQGIEKAVPVECLSTEYLTYTVFSALFGIPESSGGLNPVYFGASACPPPFFCFSSKSKTDHKTGMCCYVLWPPMPTPELPQVPGDPVTS